MFGRPSWWSRFRQGWIAGREDAAQASTLSAGVFSFKLITVKYGTDLHLYVLDSGALLQAERCMYPGTADQVAIQMVNQTPEGVHMWSFSILHEELSRDLDGTMVLNLAGGCVTLEGDPPPEVLDLLP
jgi:hypothetical protein